MDMGDMQADMDLHHMQKAHEVKQDSKRLKNVAKLHKQKMKQMKTVKDDIQEEMSERPSIKSKAY